MLIGISLLISFIVVNLIIAVSPLRVDKKPLYKITGISSLIILLTALSAYSLTWWYGVIVFGGLLFALAILIGKKIEWIKPVTQAEKEGIHMPFPLEFKEEGKGRSVYDNEFQQIMEKGFITKRLHSQRTETQKVTVQPAAMFRSKDVADTEQEEYLNKMIHASNEEENSEYMLEFDKDIVDDRIEYINSGASLIDWELPTDIEKTKEQASPMSLEVEELSDEWLKSRLDALYGEDEAATFGDDGYMDDSYTIEPFVTEFELTSDLSFDEVSTAVDEVEFEDLSQLYYDQQRGEHDGTA